MAHTDADEDELVSPSTLWATITRTPRRNPARRAPLAASSNTTTPTPTPTPRRTSPRFARARELEKTPPPLPPPKTPSRKTVAVVDESSKLTDSDEKRRKALADELFPPSPPRTAATASTPDDAGACRAGTNDVDGLDEEEEEEEEEEVVADSEVEREREDDDQLQLRPHASPGSPTFAKPSLTSGTDVRQRRRESRRTSSFVFDLDDDPASDAGVVPDSQGQGAIAAGPSSEDQGALARRLDQLQLGSTTSIGDSELERTALAKPKPNSTSTSAPDVPASTGKLPRARRRVTISIIDSSSSSEEDEDASKDADFAREDEDVERKSSPPSARVDIPVTSIAPSSTRTRPPTKTEDEGDPSDRDRGIEAGSGSPENAGARVEDEVSNPWPDDIFENDGVLIYNPTPKKRPVKLTKMQSPARLPPRDDTSSPSSKRDTTRKPNDGRRPMGGGSSLRVEVDLTCDTSDEDEGDSDYRHQSDELPSLRRAVPDAWTPSRPSAPRLPGPPPPRTPSRKPASKVPRAADSTVEPRLSTADRSRLPLELIRELDRAVFRQVWNGLRIVKDGSVGKGLPDGIEVVWNARLRNTAGRASWKTSKKTATVDGESVTTTTHHATVELSTKVTDTASKLRHTLAHELCHLAAWAIDGEMKPPHGAAFKRWAKRVMIVRPDIEVTTTHSYEIVYKYRWKCVSAVCGKIFGRHSASIDPATHGCPCGARIVPIDKDGNPKPGYSIVTATGTIVSTPKSERKKSKWLEFLQSEGPLVRKENPSLSQPEVFKVVAEQWQRAKEQAQAQAVSAGPERVAEAARLEESLEALRL